MRSFLKYLSQYIIINTNWREKIALVFDSLLKNMTMFLISCSKISNIQSDQKMKHYKIYNIHIIKIEISLMLFSFLSALFSFIF